MNCSTTAKKLCHNDDCNICFNKSFASNEKSKFLADKNINPREILKGSNKKYDFKCDKCNHLFDASLNNINNNRWCPYCSNNKLCDKDDCEVCFEKSFASHNMSKYWNLEKNNNINPRTIFKNSHKSYYFNCDKCKHIFMQQLDCINKNVWCPFCCNPPKQLCEDNNCNLCFDKSFASHEKASFWNNEKNNGLKAREVFKSSNKKYWFNCNICEHSFNIQINNITSNNQWCNICKNKTEKIVYDFILEHNFKTIKNVNFKWNKNHKTNHYLPYDFVIEDFKLIIEIDGRQHFENILQWKSDYKERQERDKYKIKLANNNGYSIIRILQEDIYYNKYDWKNIILKNIKIYNTPCVIYICKNNEYACYK